MALIDLGLPGMDGYELARSLRRKSAAHGTYLVALTGFGQAEDRKKALEPVDPARLDDLLG